MMLVPSSNGDLSAVALLVNWSLVAMAFIPRSRPHWLRAPRVLGLCAGVQEKTGAVCQCC